MDKPSPPPIEDVEDLLGQLDEAIEQVHSQQAEPVVAERATDTEPAV